MNRLRELRKFAKKQQKEIAETLDISTSAYSNYELGLREPSYDILNKLADYFGVSVDYLLGRHESPTEPIDTDLRHLTDVWHSLSDTAKLRLLAYADGLKDSD